MDTKQMSNRIKTRVPENGVTRPAPESRARKHRVRSYKSLIINLAALISLFALVFALQQLGTRHAEKNVKTEQAAQVTTVTAEKVTLQKQKADTVTAVPVQEKVVEIKNREVAMVEIQTTEEGAAQPKAEAKIILKTNTATKPRRAARSRVYRNQQYREDRMRSAELVDMLDGRHSKRYSNSAPGTYSYTSTAVHQPTYTTAQDSHSGRADRTNSAALVDMLDGRASQPTKQKSNRWNWANEVPMASTQGYDGIEETTLVSQTGTRGYATATPQEKPTYVAPSRRPAWDVNAGEHSK